MHHALMPRTPKELIEDSLANLAKALSYEEAPSPDSHTVVEVGGFDNADMAPAVARYAVALLTGWVQKDATIADTLGIKGVEHRDEVRLLVDTIVAPPEGASSEAITHWKQTSRNAWIAEVLTHALFVLHRTTTSAFVAGSVAGVLQPHPKPTRQGLDSVAIYDEATLAVVAIGETKASAEHGSTMLTRACDMFDEIDRGIFGPDLRNALGLLADVLPVHLKTQVGESLWRRERCYLPTIFHEVAFDAGTKRERLKRLEPSASRKRVIVCRIDAFETFFDLITASMPSAVDELVI